MWLFFPRSFHEFCVFFDPLMKFSFSRNFIAKFVFYCDPLTKFAFTRKLSKKFAFFLWLFLLNLHFFVILVWYSCIDVIFGQILHLFHDILTKFTFLPPSFDEIIDYFLLRIDEIDFFWQPFVEIHDIFYVRNFRPNY